MRLEEQVVKERERAILAFKELKVNDLPGARDLYELAKAYYDDALHFYDKEKLLEAFELFAYVWGLLDAGARLGLFDPGAARRHYKIEQ
ncbi:DUF357 domain-containing protein [archaeon]|nr:DUF357 domain-containing protein [archaeon]